MIFLALPLAGDADMALIDVGGSQYIIDGRLKVKSNCGSIESFTENGLKFEDGSEIEADVVVFCTGYSTALTITKDSHLAERTPP